VDFVRLDADDRAIFFMKITEVLDDSVTDNIVVGIVQRGTCCESGAGDMRQRVEVESIDGFGRRALRRQERGIGP
jgi:hypothetical protein